MFNTARTLSAWKHFKCLNCRYFCFYTREIGTARTHSTPVLWQSVPILPALAGTSAVSTGRTPSSHSTQYSKYTLEYKFAGSICGTVH